MQADGPKQPQAILLSSGRCAHTSSDEKSRRKSPRLNNADLYVVRLGRRKEHRGTKQAPMKDVANIRSVARTEDMDSSTSSLDRIKSASSGSLHDELTHPHVNSKIKPAPEAVPRFEHSQIAASRPCYRCINYMHSVGIRRVFWTNDNGQWEGGKVRDLVDAFDRSIECGFDSDLGGPSGNGFFVTKHEVLMLRRLMGEQS